MLGLRPGFAAGSIISICSIVSITLGRGLGIDALTLGVAVGNWLVMLLSRLRLSAGHFIHTHGSTFLLATGGLYFGERQHDSG